MRTAKKHVRPARIATLAMIGRPNSQERRNEARLDLLAGVVHAIRARPSWGNLDALLLPAGFFRLSEWLGPLPALQRVQLIQASDVANGCQTIARKLSFKSPGCLVIAGIDTNRPSRGFRGDQLAAAFDTQSCVGLARKIFPVDGDTNSWGRAPYLLFEPDYDDPGRFLRLANGQTALLSVCYDAFGLAELRLGPTTKLRSFRYAGCWKEGWRWIEPGEAWRWMTRYQTALLRHRPSLHLIAIHGFERPGGEVYWQRHGIATASAALDSVFTVGAGHFAERLPADFRAAPLAANAVPKNQVRAAHQRRAHGLTALDGFEYRRPRSRMSALIRLFENP